MGDMDPYLMHDSLNPLHLPSQTAAQSDQPFLHDQWHILPIHYIVPPNFIKEICPFPWGNLDPHVIYLTLGTHNPPPYTAYRSSMPFFQNLNVINNRQTGRMKMELDWYQQATSTISAMWPNNVYQYFCYMYVFVLFGF